MKKTFSEQLEILENRSSLLSEACQRFFEYHKLNEITHIASHLRTLICPGRGNNLLFRLAKEKNEKFNAYILEDFVEITITETEPTSEKVLQQTKKRALVDTLPNQPTRPIITTDEKFKNILKKMDFEDWIKNSHLLDWDVPNGKNTPTINSFTPERLIACYANTEASHADEAFAKEFGCSVEILKKKYVFSGKAIEMPLIYNYLYQIGKTTAKLSLEFVSKYKT